MEDSLNGVFIFFFFFFFFFLAFRPTCAGGYNNDAR